jgi:DNA-binding transcriptional ArsR family regulator
MSRAAAEGSALRRRQHALVFAALGDETRLALISALGGRQARSISELSAGARITRQAITKHLRVLEEAGLVHGARAGRLSLYQLDAAPLSDLREYLARVSEQWDQSLSRLKALVEHS